MSDWVNGHIPAARLRAQRKIERWRVRHRPRSPLPEELWREATKLVDDIWLLSNGNILFSRMGWAAEVTPQKKIVWRIEAPKGTEIHTIQPIGLDKVLLMQNGKPPTLMIINKRTGAVEVQHDMPDDGKGVHAQFRRLRMTAQGTFLVPFLQMNKVVEYDKDFNEIWSYAIRSPWAAIRLHNGNTLITDEGDKLTREVNAKGETVWEIKLSELPPEARLADSQSCVRLANGNTILCSRGNGGKSPQLVEVTPDKKVVWVLNDWKDLGPATAVQIFSDPARYGQRKVVAGYDLIGEPLPPSGAALVSLYQQIIQGIRQVDPDHLIILEGGKFATDFSMFDKPLDQNQVYSFHMYTWFGDDRRKKLAEYQMLARRRSTPLWVGEFGENTYPMIRSTVQMYNQCPELSGWAFWTWKKAPSAYPGLVVIQVPKSWATVMQWLGSLLEQRQPDADTITTGMREFIQAMKLENCNYDQRMEQALLSGNN